jgi:choline dehydrogenase-like flavoprotein
MRIDRQGFVEYPSIYLTDVADATLMTDAIQRLIALYRTNPDLVLTFGPGGRSHPDLDPERPGDVKAYVEGFDPVDGIFYTRLIINHWGGTAPLGGGVDPSTLCVDGTRNVHVVDASLHPAPLSAHPVATIMAVAEKAGDVLARLEA